MFVILEVHPVQKFKKSSITSKLSNFLFFDTSFFKYQGNETSVRFYWQRQSIRKWKQEVFHFKMTEKYVTIGCENLNLA